jgi:hypothetical protein
MNLSVPLHGSPAERAHASAHAIRCRPSVGVGGDVEAVGGATKEDAGSLAQFLGKRGAAVRTGRLYGRGAVDRYCHVAERWLGCRSCLDAGMSPL